MATGGCLLESVGPSKESQTSGSQWLRTLENLSIPTQKGWWQAFRTFLPDESSLQDHNIPTTANRGMGLGLRVPDPLVCKGLGLGSLHPRTRASGTVFPLNFWAGWNLNPAPSKISTGREPASAKPYFNGEILERNHPSVTKRQQKNAKGWATRQTYHEIVEKSSIVVPLGAPFSQ